MLRKALQMSRIHCAAQWIRLGFCFEARGWVFSVYLALHIQGYFPFYQPLVTFL
jgi:hypothetical protein